MADTVRNAASENLEHVLKLIKLTALLALSVLLCACATNAVSISSKTRYHPQTEVGKALQKDLENILDDMAKENISLNHDSDGPTAEITPHGQLIIAGQPVQLDAAQQKQVIDYHQNAIDTFRISTAIMLFLADVIELVSETESHLPDEQSQVAAIHQIRSSLGPALNQLDSTCDALKSFARQQQKLAKSVPQIAAYAKLDRKNYDDCRHAFDQARAELLKLD